MAAEKDGSSTQAIWHLPLIPAELGIDPVLLALLQCAAFLDLSDEAVVEPGAATEVLEHVGLYIQRLAPDELSDLMDQLTVLHEHGVKSGWAPELLELVDDFLYSCGVDDEAAEDADE